jgi:hypothetical protein
MELMQEKGTKAKNTTMAGKKKLGNKQEIIKEITRAVMWYKITSFSIIQCLAPQA